MGEESIRGESLFEKVKERGGIVQFHGLWCPYCWGIRDAVKRVEERYGLYIERREVWINPINIRAMRSLSDLFDDFNMGNFTVPTFYDPARPRPEQLLVNPGSYEMLQAWVLEGMESRSGSMRHPRRRSGGPSRPRRSRPGS